MIDLDKIGQRIKEERKYIRRISQEKMAEDLNIYQADISNMEKAKSGSGITDILKLDLIADYLNIPLATLLFGQEDKNMIAYYGHKMTLKQVKKHPLKAHQKKLQLLSGGNDETMMPTVHECGPYTIYSMVETLTRYDGNPPNIANSMSKLHTFIFYESEIVGRMVCNVTYMIQHVNQIMLKGLQDIIPFDVLDVVDVVRTLNPYWALHYFSETKEDEEKYFVQMLNRMDELKDAGIYRPILYIESVYVREECRKHGVFRMYIDLLKMLYPDSIMWLNMEPVSKAELENEHTHIPSYTISDVGQVNINAAIAEKIGFTVDADTWRRPAEIVDFEGNKTIKTIQIRKCAYFIPPEIQKIIKNDGSLVAEGRAKQRLMNKNNNRSCVDSSHYAINNKFVSEMKITYENGDIIFVSVSLVSDSSLKYIVSLNSLRHIEKDWIIEEYDSLEEAINSKYYEDLKLAESFLTICFADIKDEVDEVENFDVLDENCCDITDDKNSFICNAFEVKLKRTNTDRVGDILYATVFKKQDECYMYALSCVSILSNIEKNEFDENDIVEMFDSEDEAMKSKYWNIYATLQDNM